MVVVYVNNYVYLYIIINNTNLKISKMKNAKDLRHITLNEARQIISDNNEYIVWANGKRIESEGLVNEFGLTQYDNQPDGAMNLEHKIEDFRIEDILFC